MWALSIVVLVTYSFVLFIGAQSSGSATVLSPQATFLYPTATPWPVINYIDTIDVTYQTQWKEANLTVYCHISPANYFVFYNVKNNPIRANGTYILNNIEGNMQIHQFPVTCHMMLTEYQDDSNVVNGAVFTMTSTLGAPTTYQISTSTTLPLTSSPTTTNESQGGGPNTEPVQTSKNTAPTQTSTSSPSPSPTASSSRLSNGAKAGVGIGVGISGLVVVAGLAYFFISRRRKYSRQSTPGNPPVGPPGVSPANVDHESGGHPAPQELSAHGPTQPGLLGRYELGP